MSQNIKVSVGNAELSWPVIVTERTNKNIATSPVQLSLGTKDTPGTWRTPSIDSHPATTAQRTVQLLIDSTYPPGYYWLWIKIADSPETIIRAMFDLVLT